MDKYSILLQPTVCIGPQTVHLQLPVITVFGKEKTVHSFTIIIRDNSNFEKELLFGSLSSILNLCIMYYVYYILKVNLPSTTLHLWLRLENKAYLGENPTELWNICTGLNEVRTSTDLLVLLNAALSLSLFFFR